MLATPFTPIRQRRNSAPTPASRQTPPHVDTGEVLMVSTPAAPLLTPFTGDSTAEAHEWLDVFEKVMLQSTMSLTPTRANQHIAKTFAQYIQDGSNARIWWDGLGPTVQASWELIKAIFVIKWPRPAPTPPTKTDHWTDFVPFEFSSCWCK